MSSKNGAGAVILLLFVGSVFLFTVVVFISIPIVYVFLPLFFVYRIVRHKVSSDAQNLRAMFGKRFSKLEGKCPDFWLDESEQSDFRTVLEGRNTSAENYHRLSDLINQKRQYGISAGISQNKDGSFSRRSSAGKKLADEIRDLEASANIEKSIYESASSGMRALSIRPRLRRNAFLDFKKQQRNAIAGIVIWLLIGFFFSVINPSGVKQGMSEFISLPVSQLTSAAREFDIDLPDHKFLQKEITPWFPTWFPENYRESADTFYKKNPGFFEASVLTICLLLNLTLYFLIRPFNRYYLDKTIEQPPLVDEANFTAYAKSRQADQLDEEASKDTDKETVDSLTLEFKRPGKTRIGISLVIAAIPLWGFLPVFQVVSKSKLSIRLGLACLAIQVGSLILFSK